MKYSAVMSIQLFILITGIHSQLFALSLPAPPVTQTLLVQQTPWVAFDQWWGVWRFEFSADGSGSCTWTRPEYEVHTYSISNLKLFDGQVKFDCMPIQSTYGIQSFAGHTTKQRLFLKNSRESEPAAIPVVPIKLLNEQLKRMEGSKK